MHLSQCAHFDLPGSVFRLPSAPMMTSNSSSLTGCVLGWTSALQPIPKKKKHSTCQRTEMNRESQLQFITKHVLTLRSALLGAHLLSDSWSSGGSIRPLNSTLTWISMPSRRAILSSISWSWRIPAEQWTGMRTSNKTQPPLAPVHNARCIFLTYWYDR